MLGPSKSLHTGPNRSTVVDTAGHLGPTPASFGRLPIELAPILDNAALNPVELPHWVESLANLNVIGAISAELAPNSVRTQSGRVLADIEEYSTILGPIQAGFGPVLEICRPASGDCARRRPEETISEGRAKLVLTPSPDKALGYDAPNPLDMVLREFGQFGRATHVRPCSAAPKRSQQLLNMCCCVALLPSILDPQIWQRPWSTQCQSLL